MLRMVLTMPKHNKGLVFIAWFEGIKGLLILILAFGLLRLLHEDVQQTLEYWISFLRVNPENPFVRPLPEKAGELNQHQIAQISALTFFYGGLFLSESVGLFWGKQWAEWLTVIATGLLIPWELYEVFEHFTAVRLGLLAANVLIVVVLICILRKKKS
jgi:uncharacterized membrane protein (DUF2068 family)